eukprot:g41077.t1
MLLLVGDHGKAGPFIVVFVFGTKGVLEWPFISKSEGHPNSAKRTTYRKKLNATKTPPMKKCSTKRATSTCAKSSHSHPCGSPNSCTLLCCSLMLSCCAVAASAAELQGHVHPPTVEGTWKMHSVTPFGNATEAVCNTTWSMLGWYKDATLHVSKEEETHEEGHENETEAEHEEHEHRYAVDPDMCANQHWEPEEHAEEEHSAEAQDHAEAEEPPSTLHKECGPFTIALAALPHEDEEHEEAEGHVHEGEESHVRILFLNVSGPLDEVNYDGPKLTGYGGCLYEFEAPLEEEAALLEAAAPPLSETWTFAMLGCAVATACSLVGICLLVKCECTRPDNSARLVFYLLGLSAGTLLGAAFFSLLPETVEILGFGMDTAIITLVGIMFGMVSQQVLHEHGHGHKPHAKESGSAQSETEKLSHEKPVADTVLTTVEAGPVAAVPSHSSHRQNGHHHDGQRSLLEDGLYHIDKVAKDENGLASPSVFSPDDRTQVGSLAVADAEEVSAESESVPPGAVELPGVNKQRSSNDKEVVRIWTCSGRLRRSSEASVAPSEQGNKHNHGEVRLSALQRQKDERQIAKDLVLMNLVGEAIHSFVDGGVIGAAFLQSHRTGLIVTFAMVAHELPQELGDFALFVHAGLSPWKALGVNLAVSMTMFLGAAVTLGIGGQVDNVAYILPFAAGLFIYLALPGLMPLLLNPTIPNPPDTRITLLWVLFGVAIIGVLTAVLPGHSHGVEHASGAADPHAGHAHG